MDASQDNPQNSRKREESLSKDGKWRSFPKVPNLLQYVSNGNYYGRIKVGGKLIRESLGTSVWTNAKLKLVDFPGSSKSGFATQHRCGVGISRFNRFAVRDGVAHRAKHG